MDGGRLCLASDTERPEYFFFAGRTLGDNLEADEEDDQILLTNSDKLERMVLCTACGALHPCEMRDMECCSEAGTSKKRLVYGPGYDPARTGSAFAPCAAAFRRKSFVDSAQPLTQRRSLLPTACMA